MREKRRAIRCNWLMSTRSMLRWLAASAPDVSEDQNGDAEEATVISGTYVLGMGTSGHRAQARLHAGFDGAVQQLSVGGER